MSKHLFVDSNSLHIGEPKTKETEWQNITHWEYFKKRVQFWKYKLHRTMGRPILMRWR
jgi:hypothetical protein